MTGSYGNSMFSLLKNCQTVFPKWLQRLTFPPAVYEGSNVSAASVTLVVLFLIAAILVDVLSVVLICTLSMSEFEYLFTCLRAILVSF